jgi:hypothetical protein
MLALWVVRKFPDVLRGHVLPELWDIQVNAMRRNSNLELHDSIIHEREAEIHNAQHKFTRQSPHHEFPHNIESCVTRIFESRSPPQSPNQSEGNGNEHIQLIAMRPACIELLDEDPITVNLGRNQEGNRLSRSERTK